jgi:acyl-CoA:6-aminopenicillanic acid acyl transferase
MSTDTERSPFPTPAGRAAQMTDLDEQVVCGGPEDFMTVRRLRMRGTNLEIGRAVGTMARERYSQSAELYRTEPIYGRARRHYFQHNYPIHWERMRGVAAAFGVDPQDDGFDLSALLYHIGLPLSSAGCSAVSVPPSWTTTGHGYLSRNYDFSIGSMAEVMGFPLSPEDKAKLPPLMCEPYLMEWYPQDGGYASMAIHAADLLSGTFDGMNSAGLVVSIFADNEAIGMMGPNIEMHLGSARAIGVHELQAMRLLLDTCASVDEARETLLAIKDFYQFVPVLYLVADRTGRSFVYEHTPGRNAQYVIEGTGSPQLVTNFELHRHPPGDPLFDAALTWETNSFWRYRSLSDLIAAHGRPFTADDLKGLHAHASFPEVLQSITSDATDGSPRGTGSTAGADVRTLWHCVFDQQSGTVAYRFYLGDEMTADGRLQARRSDYLTFALQDESARVR